MRSAVLALGVLAVGCTGSHIGNPTELTLGLSAYDANEPANVEFQEAWVALDRVRLRSAEECGRRDESTDVPAPLVAELVSGQMFPTRPELETAATSYCRIEMRFHRLDEALDDVAPDVAGRSILVRGVRADGVPFEISSDANDPFRLNAEDDPFTIPDGGDALIVGFATDQWLDVSALDAAEVGERDGEPFITIDARENDELYDAFRTAMPESASLYRDDNHDGRLNASERARVLGRGELE